jgi:hypothetical protein
MSICVYTVFLKKEFEMVLKLLGICSVVQFI